MVWIYFIDMEVTVDSWDKFRVCRPEEVVSGKWEWARARVRVRMIASKPYPENRRVPTLVRDM